MSVGDLKPLRDMTDRELIDEMNDSINVPEGRNVWRAIELSVRLEFALKRERDLQEENQTLRLAIIRAMKMTPPDPIDAVLFEAIKEFPHGEPEEWGEE